MFHETTDNKKCSNNKKFVGTSLLNLTRLIISGKWYRNPVTSPVKQKESALRNSYNLGSWEFLPSDDLLMHFLHSFDWSFYFNFKGVCRRYWRTFPQSRALLHRGREPRQPLHPRRGPRGAKSCPPAGQRASKSLSRHYTCKCSSIYRLLNPIRVASFPPGRRVRRSTSLLLSQAALSHYANIVSPCFPDFGLHSDASGVGQRRARSVQQRRDQHRHLGRQRQPASLLAGQLQPHHPGEGVGGHRSVGTPNWAAEGGINSWEIMGAHATRMSRSLLQDEARTEVRMEIKRKGGRREKPRDRRCISSARTQEWGADGRK